MKIRIPKLFNIPNHSKRVRYKKISNKIGDKIKVQGGISEFKVSKESFYVNSIHIIFLFYRL